ncbi:MAG: hypothetical protein V2I67_14470 [Thermoanaerobaculales bacterium]|jgi:hypothetical protein|nr:hypothetical protein [Thermoanaerobaculales bacterium]
MKLAATIGTLLLCLVPFASAQSGAPRAWQQRIKIDLDLPVPLVELASANPFAIAVDTPPRLLASTPPKKLDVRGTALVAAYVNADGECLGGVPLELPFPGLTSTILKEIKEVRFDAATIAETDVGSWVVLGLEITGRVKESTVGTPSFELPSQAVPPEPASPLKVVPSGRLLRAPYEPQASLTTFASPRRLKVRVAAQDADLPVRVLAHITAGGRCDRFVPLDLESGLQRWLSAYLATWRLDPATLDGEPHESWVVVSTRAHLELSSLDSESVTVLRDRSFEPPPVE